MNFPLPSLPDSDPPLHGSFVDVPPARPSAPRPRASEAGTGLELAHRRALGALLRQATAIVAPRARAWAYVAPYPGPPRSRRLWRRRARTLAARIAAAGVRVRGADVLERLAGTAASDWPSAVSLAMAARRVHDTEGARMGLGYALLGAGEYEASATLFSSLLRRGEPLRRRWRALEGLALARAALGRERLALGAIESAAEEPGCAVSTLAEGLHLAIRAGNRAAVLRAAARLDMLVDPASPAFAAALARLRERARTRGLRPRCERSVRPLLRELFGELRAPSGMVARATG